MKIIAVVLEQFSMYNYSKPIKILTDHHVLEPVKGKNRSNKAYSARLTTWLDRLAHLDININNLAGRHFALTVDIR